MILPPFFGDFFPSCWGLVAAWYDGVPEAAHLRPDLFIEVQKPRDGDLVMVDDNAHCGIYWQEGMLSQLNPSQGVIYERSIAHYRNARFYRSTVDSTAAKSAGAEAR